MEEVTQQSASTSEEPAFAVHEVCEALEVSRSGFYAHQHKDQRPRRQQDRVLTSQIRNLFEQSQRSYGSPRLVRELKKQGVRTSKIRPKGTRCAA